LQGRLFESVRTGRSGPLRLASSSTISDRGPSQTTSRAILSQARAAVKQTTHPYDKVILAASPHAHKTEAHFVFFDENEEFGAFEFEEDGRDVRADRLGLATDVDPSRDLMNSSRTQPDLRVTRLRDGNERRGGRRSKRGLYIEQAEPDAPGYWSSTRRPLPSLALVAPVVLAYEGGVVWLGGAASNTLRTGADAWMRRSLAELGLTDRWFLPLALLMILLGWQAVRPKEWRFSPTIIAGMLIESLVLAVCLVGVSRLVDLGFAYLERSGPSFRLLQVGPDVSRRELEQLVGFLGAGVYEEALFRLLLVPLLFYSLRLLQTPQVLASALAVTGSALLFSLAHHAGNPGESFTWFAFVFRWMAGVFFAWVFILRGFGIAVGAHTAYDILVGWVGWHG